MKNKKRSEKIVYGGLTPEEDKAMKIYILQLFVLSSLLNNVIEGNFALMKKAMLQSSQFTQNIYRLKANASITKDYAMEGMSEEMKETILDEESNIWNACIQPLIDAFEEFENKPSNLEATDA